MNAILVLSNVSKESAPGRCTHQRLLDPPCYSFLKGRDEMLTAQLKASRVSKPHLVDPSERIPLQDEAHQGVGSTTGRSHAHRVRFSGRHQLRKAVREIAID